MNVSPPRSAFGASPPGGRRQRPGEAGSAAAAGVTRRACLGAALTPLAAALATTLTACGRRDSGHWAEGMAPIVWDRDTCARCGMALSDRRFAVQLRGGPQDEVVKFDDIGCATTWCSEKVAGRPWINDPATRLWVAAFSGKGDVWLTARQAHFVTGPTSPMGYNRAAYAAPQPGSQPFEAMAEQTAAAWPANCRPGRVSFLSAARTT